MREGSTLGRAPTLLRRVIQQQESRPFLIELARLREHNRSVGKIQKVNGGLPVVLFRRCRTDTKKEADKGDQTAR